MFDVDFQQSSTSPLPPDFNFTVGLSILHDLESVVRLSPDCRGCKPIPPPKNAAAKVKSKDVRGNDLASMQYFEVEDDLPFMPKYLWSGGVRYQADFLPTVDGCSVTVHAPAGFTSTNHWRLIRESIPEDEPAVVVSKELMHSDKSGGGWFVQIVSDARCNRTFVPIVKGFLKNSHQQLQVAFIEKVAQATTDETPQPRSRRPTLGRRRSSTF